MEPRVIIAIVAVVVILLLVVFWPFAGNKSTGASTHSTTATTTLTTGSQAAGATTGPTTTVTPAKVEFYAINYQWVYSGPATIAGGYNCGYQTHTTVFSQTTILNGSQDFYVLISPFTSACPLQINSINVSGGFSVKSTIPSLPFSLPTYSQADIQLNMQAPATNYYGPITITIRDS